MKIQIDPHTLQQMEERDISEDEIVDVLSKGIHFQAKRGRMGKYKVFTYGKKRDRKFYKQKRVEVIYVEEEGIIVTVTAYAFYGEWE